MSSNSAQSGAVASGGYAADGMQRPRDVMSAPMLMLGGYASWRPRMEAFLLRAGLEDAYKDELSSWTELHAKVREWDKESKTRAINVALGRVKNNAGVDATAAASLLAKNEDGVKREVRAMVERSLRAYGILYEAIPEVLRAQVAHIAQGYAFGVWSWLEKKYQSTEVDCVNDLIEEWMELRMNDDEESFDAYRARVNKIAVLLEQAKEKPSARIFAYKMLDKLASRYKPAVLALKAGDKLKDPANVDWEDVTAFLTAHERSEARLLVQEAEVDSAMSIRTKHWKGRESAAGGLRCYKCNKEGHIARYCGNARDDDDEEDDGRSRMSGGRDEGRGRCKRNGGEVVSMVRDAQDSYSDRGWRDAY